MFKSLKTKLLVYFFIANVAILLGFSFFIYSIAKNGIDKNLDSKLKILSQDAIVDLVENNKSEAEQISKELGEEFKIRPLHVKIIYYDLHTDKIKKEHISLNNAKNTFSIPLHEKSKLNDIYYFDRGQLRVSSMLLSEHNSTKIFFQLATTKVISNPYLDNLKFSLFIAIPIILILFLFIVNLLILKTLKPVKDVVYSVKNISTRDLSSRILSKNIPYEIEELVFTFNILLENIEDAFTRISTFSSDASHELKTPLTVIRGEIEVLLKQDFSKKECADTLKSILFETMSIEETISQLFLLSKKDTAELKNNDEDVYLDELLSEVVEKYVDIASRKDIEIIIDELVPLSLKLNKSLFKIAIGNIIGNSILYSEKNNKISLSLTNDDELYSICIKDNGCGISKENLPFIFDRFYRVDKAINRQTSSTGLGLSIVKMILDIYKYDIKVMSELEKGTTTIIKLNMNKS